MPASIENSLLRPTGPGSTRILLLARHAPQEPDYSCRSFAGDGGYPAYYHRIWAALTELGYAVTTANECLAVLRAGGQTDLVFSLYNRMPIHNPEVFVPSLCEFMRIPCVGARPNIRALAEDKWFSKHTARAAGLPVADGAIYASAAGLKAPPAFPGPYFVKNRFGAASEGISAESIQDEWAGAARVAQKLLERGMEVLVERYMPGIDITVPVLGGDEPMMLGVVHPRSDKDGDIVTEDLKRSDPLGYEMFDAGAGARALSEDVTALWRAAGPMDYLRLDYRFDPESGQRTFLEFNICCHIGRSGAICLAAGQWGLSQTDILGHVIEYSLRRQGAGQKGQA
jgi:D-alanine-D-alanine ligase